MGEEWEEHTKNVRKGKMVVVLMSLFLLLLSGAPGVEDFYKQGCACVCACRGSPLCDFTVGLAGGMFGSKEIAYEVWCPSSCLPVFGFIWKLREIRGLFKKKKCFPPYSLKKKVFMKGGVKKDLGEKRTCQPPRQTSFSPHLQTMQYFIERGFFAGA